MTDKRTLDVWRQPGVTWYLIVCLAALGAIYLALDASGLNTNACLVPVMAGIIGIPFCWSKGPFIFLVVLGVCVSLDRNRQLLNAYRSGLRLTDLLLCAATLAYVLGHYRLQSLVREVIPTPVQRRTQPSRSPVERAASRPQRTAAVSAREIGELLLWLPFWAAAAQIVSFLLPRNLGDPAGASVDPSFWFPLWRIVALLWIAGIVVFITSSVLDYGSRRRMRLDEATLYLQDVVWQETHGEQRQVNRWLAWARLGRPLGIVDRLADFATTVVLLVYLAILAWVVTSLYQSIAGG